MKPIRLFIIVMLLLNSIVLLGQIWPEGAPPFARIVNLVFLTANFLFLTWIAFRRKKIRKQA